MNRTRVCAHRGCNLPAPMGCGWGLSTGLVQWYCTGHFVEQLARLAGLLRAVGSVA